MSQTLKPRRVTTIDDALELEWHEGGSIVVYILPKMSPQVLKNWSDAALDVLRKWPSGKRYLALYDLSHSGIVLVYLSLVKRRMCSLGITEAGEEQALTNIAQREGFSARVALYISRTYLATWVVFRPKLTPEEPAQVVQYDAFYNQEAAFDWLTKTQT